MKELLEQFEIRQEKYDRLTTEHKLHVSILIVLCVQSSFGINKTKTKLYCLFETYPNGDYVHSALLKPINHKVCLVPVKNLNFKVFVVLKMELYNAKLNKAKLEKAEMSTDFTRERLELHKSLVEAKNHIDILLSREENLMEQIDLYKSQVSELQNTMVGTTIHCVY